MPSPITEEELTDSRLLSLISESKSDIIEILGRSLSFVKIICDDHEDFLKTRIPETDFNHYLTLKKIYKEFIAQNITNPVDMAQKLFAEGILHQCHLFLDNLEKKYQKVLHGLTLNENELLQCHDEIVEFLNVKIANFQKEGRDLLRHSFVHLSKILLALPQEALPESLQILFSEHKAIFKDCTLVSQNLDKILYEMRDRLLRAALLIFIDNVHRDNIVDDSIQDSKTLLELLSQHGTTGERFQRLMLHIKPESFWKIEQNYRESWKESQQIENLHPKVRRLRYYHQGKNPSTAIVTGLCVGGIRYWSSLHSSPTPTVLVAKPNFQQHMSWVDNHKVSHYQLNQGSFSIISKSSEHFSFLVSKQVFKPEVTSTSAMPSSEAKTLAEDFKGLVDTLFQELEQCFSLYPDTTTYSVSLQDPQNKISGHMVGFKCHNIKGKLSYYFCDFNEGEFYSEDLLALKEWFQTYFLIKTYHKHNYLSYKLNAIVPKTIKQKFNTLYCEKLQSLDASRDEQAKDEQAKRKNELEPKVMHHLLKSYRLHKASAEETQDHELSQKFLVLANKAILADEKEDYELCQDVLQLYQKIRVHSPNILLVTFGICNNIYEYTKSSHLDHHLKDCITAMEMGKTCVDKLKIINSNYGSIEIVYFLQKARIFLTFISLNKTEEGIKALDQFFHSILKSDQSKDGEDYKKIQEYHQRFLKLLSEEPKFIPHFLRLAEEVDVFLTNTPSLFLTNEDIKELWVTSLVQEADESVDKLKV